MIYRILSVLIFFIASCAPAQQDNSEKESLQIVCTTGMIEDMVKNIAGPDASVQSLMGPGVDPHLYKPTQGDLGKLTNADIIFYNGLLLEGKLQNIFEKMASKKPVVPIGDIIPKSSLIQLAEDYKGQTAYDPHVWFDVHLWAQCIDAVLPVLQKALPEKSADLAKRAESYRKKLSDLHQRVGKTMAAIPKENRVLITSHDAFSYFGKGYDVQVSGLQGVSTVAEFGLQDVTRMVQLIIEKKVKAVFVESSMPRKPLLAVIEGCRENGHDVAEGGVLFSDAMGEAGTPEGTYLGMVNHNIKTIEAALK